MAKGAEGLRVPVGRPFEHEACLRQSLAQQAQLNAALDLDKHEAQVVEEPREPEEKTSPAGFASRVRAEERGAAMAM
jgi:hypothetical protein